MSYCEHCEHCNGQRVEGAAIREARLKMGLTLRDVARELGVSTPYISDIERNNRRARFNDGIGEKLVRLLDL